MNKKLLMIGDIGFPPKFKAWRIIKFAKYLPRFGWQPIILSVKYPNNNQFQKMKSGLASDLAHTKIYRTRIYEPLFWKLVSSLPINPRLTLQIPDSRIGWLPFALHAGKKIIKKENIDAIFSSSGPNTAHLIAYLLHKKTKIPWVAEFRDPWTARYPKARNPIQKLEERMEYAVLKNANKIIVVTNGVKKGLLAKHNIPKENFSLITNGYDSGDFKGVKPKRFSSKFTILFFGNLYDPQDISPFIKAMNLIDPDIRNNIQLAITGRIDVGEMKKIRQAKMSLIKIFDWMPHSEALPYLVGADVLLLLLKRMDVIGMNDVLATKLFEYLVSGKPILAIVPPEGQSGRIINETKTGLVLDPSDIENTRDAILNFYNQWKTNDFRIYPNWDEIKKYDRKYLTRKLVEVLNEIVQ